MRHRETQMSPDEGLVDINASDAYDLAYRQYEGVEESLSPSEQEAVSRVFEILEQNYSHDPKQAEKLLERLLAALKQVETGAQKSGGSYGDGDIDEDLDSENSSSHRTDFKSILSDAESLR